MFQIWEIWGWVIDNRICFWANYPFKFYSSYKFQFVLLCMCVWLSHGMCVFMGFLSGSERTLSTADIYDRRTELENLSSRQLCGQLSQNIFFYRRNAWHFMWNGLYVCLSLFPSLPLFLIHSTPSLFLSQVNQVHRRWPHRWRVPAVTRMTLRS